MKQLNPRWNALFLLLALASTLVSQGRSTTVNALTPSPSSLSFGEVQVGSNQQLFETLTNSSAVNLTISQAMVAGTGFSMSGLNLPLVLAPGQHYTFSVTFTPPSSGNDSGNVSIVSDASNPNLAITLNGTGIPLLRGQLTVIPANIDFGNVIPGTNTQQTGTLIASGGSVTVYSNDVSGSAFATSGLSFPITIPAGQQVQFGVTFTPSEAGLAAGSISFASNATNLPTIESLQGVSTGTGALDAPRGAIQPEFFGTHDHFHPDAPWPSFGFGAFRIWNSGYSHWADVALNCTAKEAADPNNSCYDWTDLDSRLSLLKQHGIKEVIYTLSGVPNWADPNDSKGCDEGACHLPSDIHPDGSGSNATWKNWIRAVALHVNKASYLQTHARVTAWEPWNEWWRNPVVSQGRGREYKTISINATYAQMARLAEDARCIIRGEGTVNGARCTSTAIDRNAKILTPSTGARNLGAEVMQNFLYCNNHPLSGSHCDWSTSNPRGAKTADVMNSHFYTGGARPESIGTNIAGFQAFMQPGELAKPLWSDETAMSHNDFVGPPKNENSQAAFLSRLYLVAYSAGMSELYWYSYDDIFARGLWLRGTGETLGAKAYQQTYDWLVGATMTSKCNANSYGGTVLSCQFTRQSRYQAEAIWDTDGKYVCHSSCPTRNLVVPATYLHYRDLEGNLFKIRSNHVVPVGAKPILLENQ